MSDLLKRIDCVMRNCAEIAEDGVRVIRMGVGDSHISLLIEARDEIERLEAEVERLREGGGGEPTLERIQREQVPWVKHNFGERPGWMPLLGLQEEIGELAHAFLKREQGIRMDENHDAGIRDAVADIVIFLLDFCSSQGINLESEVVSTWERVKHRDWKADSAEKGGGDG